MRHSKVEVRDGDSVCVLVRVGSSSGAELQLRCWAGLAQPHRNPARQATKEPNSEQSFRKK